MPKYIRRSIFAISVDDPKLGEKAFDSWADAIVLHLVKVPGRNWQDDMKSQIALWPDTEKKSFLGRISLNIIGPADRIKVRVGTYSIFLRSNGRPVPRIGP